MTITLRGVRVHNLKNVDLDLKLGELIVFTGVSGSGKSSLVFDTITVEGQRRYLESLSAKLKATLGDLKKPDVDRIEGLPPTVAVEQKAVSKNPRSTVGTLTGIYDLLRVLFARVGTFYCPVSGEIVNPQSEEDICRTLCEEFHGQSVLLIAPLFEKRGTLKTEMEELVRKGFIRARVDGTVISLTDPPALKGDVLHTLELVLDRIEVEEGNRRRLKEGIHTALHMGKQTMRVVGKKETLFSTLAFSEKSGLSYPALEPHDFSFNTPQGMCPTCEGLGIALAFDLSKILDPEKSIAEDCCAIAGAYHTVKWKNIYDNLAEIYGFSVDTPWKNLSKEARKIFLEGSPKKWLRMRFIHPEKKTRWIEFIRWRGILEEAKRRLAAAMSEGYKKRMRAFMTDGICPDCKGSRLKPYPSATRIGGKTLHEITQMPVNDLLPFLSALTFPKAEQPIATPLLQEIQRRLEMLLGVGLHYLTLERTAPTLSGGEAQRVRLSSELGAGLEGVLYVLDEPSIGLHSIDNRRLIDTLFRLRDQNNTVLVVEHDKETILSADTVVDIGPGAGREGGEILFAGPPSQLLDSPRSVTAKTLRRGKKEKRRVCLPKDWLTVKAATHHNLKGQDIPIPLGCLTAVAGVSGSGKSSLVLDILYPALANAHHGAQLPVGAHKGIDGMEKIDKIIAIDQAPIGRSPRSNSATYTKLFDDIRALFAALPEARAKGYAAGQFSFNVEEGSCPFCHGRGQIEIDMDFLENVWKRCPECNGRRFDTNTISIKYKGKAIDEVLEMSVDEAFQFFEHLPQIASKLERLKEVGLGYLSMGQSATTLSGGEAQRIKLAKELIRPPRGHTLYILDEPTTGLHFEDIAKLMGLLHALVDGGNSVLIIEHNLDVIEEADWVLELGPAGGAAGGEIVFSGSLEKLKQGKTATARAFQEELTTVPAKLQRRGERTLKVEGASLHNLKHVSLEIPHGKMTVFAGPSGSGKSSLAFDTLFAEGQRRYTETLPMQMKGRLVQMDKPPYRHLSGLMPAIAIEQKHHAGNPRSTVGTITEVYDYLRLLFAHAGIAYCPESGHRIESITTAFVAKKLMELPQGTTLTILAPLDVKQIASLEKLEELLIASGFTRLRLNGTFYRTDEKIPFDPKRKNQIEIVIDRLILKEGVYSRLLEGLDTAAQMGKGTLYAALDNKDIFFNLSFAVPETGKSYPPLTPHSFSYNREEGMCPTCQGLGIEEVTDLASHPEISSLTPLQLWKALLKENLTREAHALFVDFLKETGIPLQRPIDKLNDKEKNALFFGSSSTTSRRPFRGINPTLVWLGKTGGWRVRRSLAPYLVPTLCTHCHGARLKPLAQNVQLHGEKVADIISWPLETLLTFLVKNPVPPELKDCLAELQKRLVTLTELGLGYLSLFRSAPTLSGGETERLQLARALSTGLRGTLYVFDEPTIGLSSTETQKLLNALEKLKNLGNTLIVVEHDLDVIKKADLLVEFGPKAGPAGGEIIYTGPFAGSPLSRLEFLPPPQKKRAGEGAFIVEGAKKHNLKNLTLSFPIKNWIGVTGVSGSGKSSLVDHTIAPAVRAYLRHPKGPSPFIFEETHFHGLERIKHLVHLDQNPLGQTIRADVSTYIDLNPLLRQFYAQLPEAAARGLQPRNFSANHLKGMCRACWGLGTKTITLQYLPSVTIPCNACQGERLNPVSASITYRGQSFGALLRLTAHQAKETLPQIPKAHALIDQLIAVGLGYLPLGQPIQTLSGGEAQRLRLVKELARPRRSHTLYLFDEPTIGLHPSDIALLIPLFHALVDQGNTLITVEHNPLLLAQVDHLITLGPGAGTAGGWLIKK